MADRVALAPLEDALRLAREIGLTDTMGRLSAFRMLANNPNLAKGVFAQHAALRFKNTLSTRLRELMIMRIAWLTGSEYEWTQHWHVAIQSGIPAEDILAVRDWRKSDRLTEADRAALGAVEDTHWHGRISDSVWIECAKSVGGPAELVEMVVAIGHWTMFSQLLRSLEVPLEDGAVGWPPDGAHPPS